MALDVKVKDFTQRDRQSNRTLGFGLWNGGISVQVYDSQNMKNKMFRKSLSDEEIIMVQKLIAKIVSGAPETKASIQFTKYDPQSKQFKLDSIFEFGKDSKQVYHITVSDVTKQQTFTFQLKARATMTMGNEPLNDANLSAVKVEALKNWITNAQIWAPATVIPFDPNKKGGGGGYHGGGSVPVQTTPDVGGDGIPF